MLRPLTILLLLAPALHAAEGDEAASRKKVPAVSLLPDGSQLHGVMLPRYDENNRLVGVLKAEAITLVNNETIAGETIAVEFYNDEQKLRGRVDLEKAVFNQVKGLLESADPVLLQADRISARGRGLTYAFEQGEGFLLGPVTTWTHAPTETTMNSSTIPLRAAGIAGMSLLCQTLVAAQPKISDADRAAVQSASASKSPAHAEAMRVARADLRESLDASAAATAAAKEFLEKAELVSTAPAENAAPPAEPKPLDVKPGPDDTVINCDGGMYFDADEGVFVFLKNVRVTDPRFTLSGANELKIFTSKKPDAPEKTKTEAKTGIGLGAAKFGDVERIVATGAVRILQKATEAGKDPVEASGTIFTYRPKTGEIVLSGGYPWVQQGTQFARAKEPNLTLRIDTDGEVATDEGNWEIGFKLDRKD